MTAQKSDIDIQVSLRTRDSIRLSLRLTSQGEIARASLTGVGCTALLTLISSWRVNLKGELLAVPLPQGEGHAEILLREVILKAQGRWDFPYKEEELCHCRAVPTDVVDRAVIGGCHSALQVAKQTSAGTSCGTCRPDTEAIIAYRLGHRR